MHHGAIELFAYQETLLLMAVFGIAVLAMIWAGFRRWLQYKDKVSRLIAEQTAERSAQYSAQMERVEARLDTIERIRPGDGAVHIEARRGDPLAASDITSVNK